MFKETIVDKMLFRVKKLMPKSVFNFFQPAYHTILAYAGAFIYGFPSKKLKVIGVTGTKGKSTVVYLISKILEAQLPNNFEARLPSQKKPSFQKGGIAACGSLGFKIKDKEWPNTLKMTMPGRFRLQKLMTEAVRAGCKYFVLEVTSEGIKQKRHLGIQFDCAVFTNLHKEHIESHGSFEKYYQAKQELFKRTDNIHVINADDANFELFSKFHSKKTIFFGLKKGDIAASNLKLTSEEASFEVYGTAFNTHLAGEFNVSNCLAALAVGVMYGLDLPSMKPVLESVKYIPGRMEFIQRAPFAVVVDYAHTPESLEKVYQTLKLQIANCKEQINKNNGHLPFAICPKLICILGAAGGGRDKWKRPEFGRIAAEYCGEIILTNEDPYDEKPEAILEEIASGFSQAPNTKSQIPNKFSRFSFRKSRILDWESQSGQIPNIQKILDRKEAIKKALILAKLGDTVIITGKGSETSMAVAGNKKIPWSDKEIVKALLK